MENPYPLSRRELLQLTGMGFGMVGLGGLLADNGMAATVPAANNPFAPKPPHFKPRAKHLIHYFLAGGPSQVDTFDPKPMLTKYHGMPLPTPNPRTENETGAAVMSPFSFKKYGESGLEVSELFKEVGEQIDDFCVLRSTVSDQPFHDQAMLMMSCGDNRLVRPSMGSWITYGLGSENQNLPGFIAMSPSNYPGPGVSKYRSAFLPNAYQGSFINSSDSDIDKLIENIRNGRMDIDTQRRQIDFLQSLNQHHLKGRHGDSDLDARIEAHEQAFRMQIEASDVLDISREPKHVLEMYGDTVQGRQLLMARRLVEHGVRSVQVWFGNGIAWDSHSNLEEEHRELSRQCSQPIAALVKDLKQHGLLDETLVVVGGEFGRTPTTEMGSADGKPRKDFGRDHNPYGFTTLLAGGGVKAGMAYGATDEFGFHAVENPVHIHDLHATILHLMGLDHEQLTYRYAGRDFRLTDVHGNVITGILA
jgi:hypothetical protein